MTICLQGGGEFSPGCRAMDADLVRRAGGRVVVSALAGTPGRDYDTATANGVRHFRAVGAGDVVGAPDAREDPAGAVAALDQARLLVLPGGSPSRLLTALQQTPVGELLAKALADGVVLMGSSAGAMVLGAWTVLPDQRDAGALAVVPALGLAGDVTVIPHWSGGSSRGDWLRALDGHLPGSTALLGLPEESGVLVQDGVLTAVGRSPSRLVALEVDLEPGQAWTLLRPS